MRVIKHGRDKPFVVKLGDLPQLKGKLDQSFANTELHICACGLSKHKPFCDGSHRFAQNEEKNEIAVYDANGNRSKLSKETAMEQIEAAPNEYE
ncbi:MAG: CDGSH iron-sulfur domain-containing protein [Candidatus Micrarchaeia archaeon]